MCYKVPQAARIHPSLLWTFHARRRRLSVWITYERSTNDSVWCRLFRLARNAAPCSQFRPKAWSLMADWFCCRPGLCQSRNRLTIQKCNMPSQHAITQSLLVADCHNKVHSICCALMSTRAGAPVTSKVGAWWAGLTYSGARTPVSPDLGWALDPRPFLGKASRGRDHMLVLQ